jgi:hypothetical protein
MRHRVFRVAFAVIWLAAITVAPSSVPALAQSTDAKPTNPAPANPQGQEPAKETPKIDEYAEAQKAVAGPAGNPECVWLGTRVVSLLLNDDLDTAFRHLDLYDRFGCPSGHIQASFRCLVLQHADRIDTKPADPKADPKAADNTSKDARVRACWLNPTQPPAAPAPAEAPAAAAQSPIQNR